MPNITTLDAGNSLALNPTETGIDARAQAARRINSLYTETASVKGQVLSQLGRNLDETVKVAGGVAVAFAEHREISHGAAAYATMFDDLTNKWNKTVDKADPNDPTVAAKFRAEVLEPALKDYKAAFVTEGGQQYAEQRLSSVRNHMFEKTSADMGTLAAQAVAVNVRTMANQSSNTAMRDPSTVPELIANATHSVGAMVDSSPNIRGVAAAKAKGELTEHMIENIVKAGAIGAIQKSPDPEKTANEWGEKYSKYINGAELKMLASAARQQLRASRTDELYAKHLDREKRQDISDAAEGDYIKKLYSGDPEALKTVTARTIANDDRLILPKREHLIGLVEREMKPESDAKMSAINVLPLMADINRPAGDPKKMTDTGPIIAARVRGDLTRADFNDLMKQFTDSKTSDGEKLNTAKSMFIKGYEGLIDKSVLGLPPDANGKKNFYRFQFDLNRAIEQARKAGKDPHDLFDPTSPMFFAKPERLRDYQRNMTEELDDRRDGITRPVKPAPIAPDTKAKLDGIFGVK